ncbi:MAG TPA: hypothetical protein VGM03_00455, partial [Phycisphaerae bacterium]
FDGTQGNVNILGSFSGTVIQAGYAIVSANPPADNPYLAGMQPFIDPLQTGNTNALTQGIGAAGTPDEGPYSYAPISVTFGGTPMPAPSPSNVTVSCTRGVCPTVTGVTGAGAGPYMISLSQAIPPSQCTTLQFAATPARLQYRYAPGDVNQDGVANTQDLLEEVQRLNDLTANDPANRARYNVNRSLAPDNVNTTDLLRIVQLLNGVNTTQVFNGVPVAACPP